MSAALWQLSASEIASQVTSRTVSATEVVSACLNRIGATNPTINAICTLVVDRALAQAHASDRRLARGEPARDLEGVPFVVKDVIQTAGIRTTCGSRLFEHNVPELDGISLHRLAASGAI